MGRRKWRQCPETGKLIEVPLDSTGRPMREGRVAIHGDIETFRSPIDGSIISDRAQLREHKLRHEVVNIGEFGPNDGREYFERKARERANFHSSPEQRRMRKQSIIEAVKKLGG